MTKKLVGLVTYLTLAACAHDKRFYTEDFRETIPVTSNVIDVGYNYDANGQNTEITFYDAHTGKEYRLARTMSNKRLKLEDAVAFAGWQNDLASFYKTADAFIQTSLFEGYGLSLVEAGLSALPVITTPVGIAIELAHGKDAYIYPHDHPELFVEGIIALIENNQERKNLKINLQKTLESKLLSREDYMAKIRDGWESIATKV